MNRVFLILSLLLIAIGPVFSRDGTPASLVAEIYGTATPEGGFETLLFIFFDGSAREMYLSKRLRAAQASTASKSKRQAKMRKALPHRRFQVSQRQKAKRALLYSGKGGWLQEGGRHRRERKQRLARERNHLRVSSQRAG
jgi:hypothetical protein